MAMTCNCPWICNCATALDIVEEPLAKRPCLHTENGCTSQIPRCGIPTIAEAEWYVKGHGSKCNFNPVVMEERQHRWQQEEAAWRQEEAAKDRHESADLAATMRCEATEDEERRKKRDYRRQREAQEAVPTASRPMVQD